MRDAIKNNLKKQTLMNKEIEILDFLYDEETHTVYSVENIKNKEYAPLQILEGKPGISRSKLNEWWQNRAIPSSRENIKPKLMELGIESTTELLERCFGLSLSDQYWVRDYESNLKWKDIHFFEHEFSQDVGDFLLGNNDAVDSLLSPDNSSDGMLHKKWKIINGERCLIKSGNSIYNQEPFNEVIASSLYERLLDPDDYVSYSLLEENEKYYSVCKDMIDVNTELVPAYALNHVLKKRANVSLYEPYIHCCEEYGLNDVRNKLEKMIVCDYILANIDRHWGNFGIIRDVNTLKWLKVAPLYDNGSSLCATVNTNLIHPYSQKLSKINPFTNDFRKQLELVKDMSWFQENSLQGFVKEAQMILEKNPLLDEKRIEAVGSLINANIETVKQYKAFLEN